MICPHISPRCLESPYVVDKPMRHIQALKLCFSGSLVRTKPQHSHPSTSSESHSSVSLFSVPAMTVSKTFMVKGHVINSLW